MALYASSRRFRSVWIKIRNQAFIPYVQFDSHVIILVSVFLLIPRWLHLNCGSVASAARCWRLVPAATNVGPTSLPLPRNSQSRTSTPLSSWQRIPLPSSAFGSSRDCRRCCWLSPGGGQRDWHRQNSNNNSSIANKTICKDYEILLHMKSWLEQCRWLL